MKRIAIFLLIVSAASFALAQAAAPQASAANAQMSTTRPTSTSTPPQPASFEDASRLALNEWKRLQDWAQLDRYRQQNAELPPPKAGEQRVVFMGDSITDIWQQPQFGFFQGKPYVDRGISGQTTPQMLVRFRPDVVDLKPKAVVILAGTNDIAGNTGPMTNEEIEANLQSMGELADTHQIKVVVASILPTSNYHVQPGAAPQTTVRPMDRIKALNEWIKTYAAAHGYVYLDYFSAMVDDKGLFRAELSEDDLHPNAKGYAIMAPLAEAAIQKALK